MSDIKEMGLVQILPLNIKGAAGGLANMVNWLSAFAGSYSFNFLMEWSPAGESRIFLILSFEIRHTHTHTHIT